MNIWLVSHYSMPPQYEMRFKNLKYAENLMKMGHNVLIVTASTIHNTDVNLLTKNQKVQLATYNGVRYAHVYGRSYGNNKFKRILNLIDFQRNFHLLKTCINELPDVIVCDCNCINYHGVYRFAKKNKIKFIADIRDLWPLAIVEYLGYKDNNPMIKLLYRMERNMYKKSNAIIFSIEGGKDYITEKKWDKKINLDKVYHINHGIDLKEFNKNIEEHSAFTLDKNKFNIVYAGSIRDVNKVDLIIEAALKLQNEGNFSNIHFCIFGEGNKKEELERYVDNNNMKNVTFYGNVEKKYIPNICHQASVNIITVQSTRISNYGVSWNKLFDYFAAGRPVISTELVKYDLIERYQCGESIKACDADKLAQVIKNFYQMSNSDYQQMCKNALEGAKEYDFELLTNKLMNVINSVF